MLETLDFGKSKRSRKLAGVLGTLPETGSVGRISVSLSRNLPSADLFWNWGA